MLPMPCRATLRPMSCSGIAFRWTLALAVAASPGILFAHVKWFAGEIDTARPPLPLEAVVTPVFLGSLAAFATLVMLGFLADEWIARRWPTFDSSGVMHADGEEKLVRIATGAYFLSLWNGGAAIPSERADAILTPELVGGEPWIGLLQLAIAVFVIWRPTCILAAAGIVVLYGYCVAEYAVFHLVVYVYFFGIAAYLALTTLRSPRAVAMRMPSIVGCLVLSLMWSALEKLLYPQWVFAVLRDHPEIAFGIDFPVFTVLTGFVEFSLAFLMITGRGLLRIGAALFMAIFLAAILEFGRADAVGHIPTVAIFLLICLHGTSPLQDALRLGRRSMVVDAGAVVLLYLGIFGAMVAGYYGLHWAVYGR